MAWQVIDPRNHPWIIDPFVDVQKNTGSWKLRIQETLRNAAGLGATIWVWEEDGKWGDQICWEE